MVRHFVNILLFYLPPSRFFSLRRLFLRIAKIRIGYEVNFCGRSWIYGRGEVTIGDRTWISPGCNIFSHQLASINIGSDCDIGPNLNIIVGSHKIGLEQRRAGAGIARPIKIGDGCWIGANVTIIDGVEIAKGCIVAAGSVVIVDVPPNVMIAGVPAVMKRELS